ncbi:xylulose kinase [Pelomyxa schiedti]|nr:xylulose kinase [Pelomyxa schiedti]
MTSQGARRRLSLGLDVSTQSITAVVVDIDTQCTIAHRSFEYATDPRTRRHLHATTGTQHAFLEAAREPGDARQPAPMFVEALDAIMGDLAACNCSGGGPQLLGDVVAVNFSAQQHAHVWLAKGCQEAFNSLRAEGAASRGTLADQLSGIFSTESVRIWMTSCTEEETRHVRSVIGSSEAMLQLSGSDAPLREPGDARQPAPMFVEALDAIVGDLAACNCSGGGPQLLGDVVAVNFSAQQHAHVWLAQGCQEAFNSLRAEGAASRGTLVDQLSGIFSTESVRIWMTSCTEEETRHVRSVIGSSEAMLQLSGSDAPLRFSAFGIRRTALQEPEIYNNTQIIHQLSSFMPAVLSGKFDTPLDWGNACGTSLMDYINKQWSDKLLEAVAGDLPGGAAGLREKLPTLNSATTVVGNLASYFVEKFHMSPDCVVGIGSGDNPQSKVLVQGSMLSLGTSFVIMAETDGRTTDQSCNAMYDGIDRPFIFGCRTNGALPWDKIRQLHGNQNFTQSDNSLVSLQPGHPDTLLLWQDFPESFPVSPKYGPKRIGYSEPQMHFDFPGIVDSTLGLVYLHSQHVTAPGDTLYVTGGPTSSLPIMQRVAAIWNRRVVPIEKGGAALGAAAAGAFLYNTSVLHEMSTSPSFCTLFIKHKDPIIPVPADVEMYHRKGGYLELLAKHEQQCVSGL